MRTRVMLTCLVMALSTFFAILWNQTSSLHIFMWSGYIKPELIKTFEEQFHCRVYTDSFDSNEAMYSKLKFSSSGYDIIVPSSYYIELLARQKIIEPILPQDIPNLVYIDKSFLEKIHAPQSDCGIPFLLSFSGIAYRSDRVREKVDSWTIFSHQKYKGRMTLLNDIRETIGAALVTKGFSPNSLSKNELTEAKNVLLHWKKNIAKFEKKD